MAPAPSETINSFIGVSLEIYDIHPIDRLFSSESYIGAINMELKMMRVERSSVKDMIAEAEEIAREALAACSQCLICLASCASYRATRDPRLSPPRRLKAAAKVLLNDKVTEDDMYTLYTCSMCGACTALCPYGIEVWRLVHAAKMKLSLEGKAPRSLEQVAVNGARSGHSFTLDPKEPRRVLEEAARKAGVEPGAPGEALYVPSPFETTLYPDRFSETLQLLRSIGVEVTVSPEALDLGGNVAVDAARPDIGAAMLERVVEEAKRLGAKTVITSACGADVKLVHMAEKYGLTRLGGVEFVDVFTIVDRRAPRRLLESTGEGTSSVLFTSCGFCRFGYRYACPVVTRLSGSRLMKDRPPLTFCCGGGGGVNYLREKPFTEARSRVYRWRAERIMKQGISEVVTPCIKCYTVLRHGLLLARGTGKVRVAMLTTRLLQRLGE